MKAALAPAIAVLLAAAMNDTPRAGRSDFAAVDANVADQAAFDRLLSGLPQIRFDDDGTPRTFYVWEGDMALSAEEIRAIIFARKAGVEPARGPQELLLQLRSDGQPGYWMRGKRTLSWAADCASFETSAQCATARQLFTTAARDWVRACGGCGLSFREVAGAARIQPGDGAGQPTLVLRYQPDQFDYLAIAFFANDPAFKRFVSVTPGFFSTSFDNAGILRHEIGHVLGYRHEHNRALTGCHFEDDRWVALTPYDPKSVMHYFCGGGGTRALQLTASDIAGHRQLYRRP
ncbi:hypothetical protein ABC347_07410 [Sphingomonas sp. 1P06PA]|uniref:hypothetical protein n=1 Tax=Sphingomonas sp. 1P06PA TaxID=554121 RepID=UPI0039A64667